MAGYLNFKLISQEMKIGIDIRPLMDRYYGGISEFTHKLLLGLLAIDRQNQYILFYNSGRDLSRRIPGFEQPNLEIRQTRYPNKIFNYLLQKGLGRPRPDKILGVDRFFMPHFNFIALDPGTKLALTVHDLSFLRFKEYFSRRKNAWHYLLNATKLMARADTIIAVSENTKRDIVELAGIDEDRISVVPSGLDRRFRDYRPGAAEIARIRSKYRLPDRFILSLSTIEPRKNIGGLIRAFDIYCQTSGDKTLRLVIAGALGWKYGETLRLWRASPYKDRIVFIKYAEEEDKPALYRLAEIFAYPSLYEGFGFPPLEAMASGCPVVAGANSSLGEVCGQAAILADPHDPAAIASALARIRSEAGLREELVKRGLAQSLKFGWEQAARAYYRLLF